MADVVGATDGLIQGLTAATTTQGLYPTSHPRVQEAVGRLADAIATALTARRQGEITLLVVDRELAVDGEPWHRASLHCASLVRVLSRMGVERLTLAAGITTDELEGLLSGLSGRRPLAGSTNAVIGRIALSDGEGTELDTEELTSLEGCLDGLRGALEVLTVEADGAMRLERSVWQLIEATAREDRAFTLLSSLRSHTDHLYRHAINTCLYALFLARALGIEGGALHDLAIGALLHDIGLLEVPTELLGRRGRLSAEERQRLERHCERGATKLAGMSGVPSLAVLVAYEHHLHWNGQGGFPEPGRRPGLASQITAVADGWDCLMGWGSVIPGQTRLRFASDGLRRRAGSALSPVLVEGFLSLVAAA